MEPISLSHKELITIAQRWLTKTKGCGFALAELSTAAPEIPDCIGFKNGISYLVECKTNRADFMADSKKFFRRKESLGMGNWRYYMVPAGLVKPEEIPPLWGLIYVRSGKCYIQVKAELQKRNMPNEIKLLCSALRRVAIRGDLDKIYEKDPRR